MKIIELTSSLHKSVRIPTKFTLHFVMFIIFIMDFLKFVSISGIKTRI
jgi:hypothetical protein